MGKYIVRLYREATDLLCADVEVECNSSSHGEIVAEAIGAAEKSDKLDWRWHSCGGSNAPDPTYTDKSDVREVA